MADPQQPVSQGLYTIRIRNPSRRSHTLVMHAGLRWDEVQELVSVYQALGYGAEYINVNEEGQSKAA